MKLSRAYLVRESHRQFHSSFLVDIGASRSVVALKKLNRIFKAQGRRFSKLTPSASRYKFAEESFESLGRTKLLLETTWVNLPYRFLLMWSALTSQRFSEWMCLTEKD